MWQTIRLIALASWLGNRAMMIYAKISLLIIGQKEHFTMVKLGCFSVMVVIFYS